MKRPTVGIATDGAHSTRSWLINIIATVINGTY